MTPQGQTNLDPPRLLLKFLLDPLRLHYSRLLTFLDTPKKTWITSSKHSSKLQRVDLETSSRPKPRTSTAVGIIWSVTISVTNIKIILPPTEPPGQTGFCLQPPFCDSNQLPLTAAQAEARSKKLGSNLLGQVQGVPPKGPRRLPSRFRQSLDKDQTRLSVLIKEILRLGRIPGAPTDYIERVRPYRCPQ